jgi:hypothetical protein
MAAMSRGRGNERAIAAAVGLGSVALLASVVFRRAAFGLGILAGALLAVGVVFVASSAWFSHRPGSGSGTSDGCDEGSA